jgi:predicted MFS family arabinose efflux permease
VGGALLTSFWWGSVFLINVPVAVAGLLCAWPLVPDSRNPAARRPDAAGALLALLLQPSRPPAGAGRGRAGLHGA